MFFAGFLVQQRVDVLKFGQNIGIIPKEKMCVCVAGGGGAICRYHTLL